MQDTTSARRPPVARSTGLGVMLAKLVLVATLVLKVLLWPLLKVLNWIFPADPDRDGIQGNKAARVFGNTIRSMIGEHPFGSSGYTTVVRELSEASNTPPLLLVYLHSPLHPQANALVRKLFSPSCVEFLQQNNTTLRCFGASLATADGVHAASVLQVTHYPSLLLMTCRKSGRSVKMEIALRLEGADVLGHLTASQLQLYLETVHRRHLHVTEQEQFRQLQREEEARLRREQDAEFQETLAADQRREAEQREALELERLERERVESEKRQAQEMKERTLDEARTLVAVAVEPAPGTTDTARLRLTLPTGARIDRRFQSTDKVETVRAFLILHFHEQDIGISNFELSSNFPRRTFRDSSQTLQEAGLVPQAVIMIQDLDA
eukprot:CAMPEP_0198288414 /NCGR_PEP_ID=MMETSP1449-20131203/6913_1 /TAXON_ID=420275 /ORGANISM="Attheya septentrionalis, Strain CCMP2084" /LENGTH=379 /DNA_ID=CAMNT_0043986541 /DNA_START=167 /DNA_END=1306 /DNA_ORIENTATION=+